MSRLPTTGSDDGIWGDILNDFLLQSHNTDGTIKSGTISSLQLTSNAVQSSKILDGAVTQAKLADGSVTNLKLDTSTQAAVAAALSASQPGHTHGIDDVSGLQGALDSKSATTHTHADTYYTKTETDGRYVRTVNGIPPDGSGNVVPPNLRYGMGNSSHPKQFYIEIWLSYPIPTCWQSRVSTRTNQSRYR
jgi:hypothetical protein